MDCLSRSPQRASDAGLRRRRCPTDAASLLPGLVAATRTGHTPTGDNELQRQITNPTDDLLSAWAHERSRLTASCSQRRMLTTSALSLMFMLRFLTI